MSRVHKGFSRGGSWTVGGGGGGGGVVGRGGGGGGMGGWGVGRFGGVRVGVCLRGTSVGHEQAWQDLLKRRHKERVLRSGRKGSKTADAQASPGKARGIGLERNDSNIGINSYVQSTERE